MLLAVSKRTEDSIAPLPGGAGSQERGGPLAGGFSPTPGSGLPASASRCKTLSDRTRDVALGAEGAQAARDALATTPTDHPARAAPPHQPQHRAAAPVQTPFQTRPQARPRPSKPARDAVPRPGIGRPGRSGRGTDQPRQPTRKMSGRTGEIPVLAEAKKRVSFGLRRTPRCADGNAASGPIQRRQAQRTRGRFTNRSARCDADGREPAAPAHAAGAGARPIGSIPCRRLSLLGCAGPAPPRSTPGPRTRPWPCWSRHGASSHRRPQCPRQRPAPTAGAAARPGRSVQRPRARIEALDYATADLRAADTTAELSRTLLAPGKTPTRVGPPTRPDPRCQGLEDFLRPPSADEAGPPGSPTARSCWSMPARYGAMRSSSAMSPRRRSGSFP